VDWGEGHYEEIGAELLPAAEVVVRAAAPTSGEHLVDLGCGDGNAALLAAARGARVTGIDPATRLLEAAATRAAQRSLDATFLEGVAGAIPLPDAAADVIVSVFGVIFAPDAPAAAEEIARVAAPTSRVVLSAWRPRGAIAVIARLRNEAVSRAKGVAADGPPPFAWHEESALRELFEPHGFTVSITDAALPIVASSAEGFLDRQFRAHPGWLEAGRVLDGPAVATLRRETLDALADANEDPAGFRITSDYAVVTMRRASVSRRPGV
jgi:SAM-dependent methyltransferase